MAEGNNSFGVSPDGGDPYEQLLAQVRQAAEGEFDILGEMGRSKSGNVVYLAREIATEHLVAMKLSKVRGPGGDEFSLEVVKTLDGTVPGLESKCPECKAILPDWDRFCLNCGADLTGTGPAPGADEAAQMLEAVRAATAGEYDILGKMDRANGGPVYFARDLKRDKLVALRLRQDPGSEPGQASYSIGETNVFRPLAAELGATQIAPAGSYQPLPPPAAAPPPPPAPRPSSPVKAPAKATRSAPQSRARLIAGGLGALLVVVVGYFAFRGGDEPVPPVAPPPAPVAVTPPPEPSPEPPPPVVTERPAPAAVSDSGRVTIGIPLPAGTRLTVDGRPVRGTSFRVSAGTHNLTLTAPGFAPFSGRVSVAPGQTAAWRPTLARIEDPAESPSPPPPPVSSSPSSAPAANCARAVARTDWAAAAGLCPKEAEGGDVAAQRTVAMMYDEGRGVGQDRALAVTWYTRAANAGDHRSEERLGYLYRDGLGTRRDEQQSAMYFRRAADAGLLQSALEYGVAVDEGRGLSQNDAEAAVYYRRAAEGGGIQAARRLGRLYERGDGVAKSETEAAKWYRQAAEKGDRDGQYYLGRLYKDGKGVEKSPALALEWFQKAAAQGHKEAAEEARKLTKS